MKILNIFLSGIGWITFVFLSLFSIIALPTISAVILFTAALICIPIKPIKKFIVKIFPYRVLRILVVAALFVAGMLLFPTSDTYEQPQEETTVVEKTFEIDSETIASIENIITEEPKIDTHEEENNEKKEKITKNTETEPTFDIEPDTHSEVSEQFVVIDTFVKKYNEIATTIMSDGIEINIHDKNGGHYRTEYRLNAFKNAVAKQYKIGDATIDIVHTKSLFGDDNIRVYLNTESIDLAQEAFDSIVRIVYPDVTDDELLEAHQALNSDISSNILRNIMYYYIQSYNELFMDNVIYAE